MPTGSVAPRTAPVAQYSANGSAANLQPGQVLLARVVEALENGSVRLATREGLFFDVKPSEPIAVGTRVMLHLEGAGNNLKVTIHPAPENSSQNPSQAQATTTANAASAARPTPGALPSAPNALPAQQPAVVIGGSGPAPAVTYGPATPAAAHQPAATQTPLPAATQPVVGNPNASAYSATQINAAKTAPQPGPVSTTSTPATTPGQAAGTVGTTAPSATTATANAAQAPASTGFSGLGSPPASTATPAQVSAYAATLSGGAKQSGPLTNTAGAPATNTGESRPAPPPAATPSSPARAALSEMVRTAINRQDSLAPLFANLALAAGNRQLPDTITRAIEQVLGFRVPAQQSATATGVRKAFQASGVFREGNLAKGLPAPPAGDLKSALMLLKGVLDSRLDGEAKAYSRGNGQAAPPRKGGQPSAQRAAVASIPHGTLPQDAMRILLGQTEAALDRVRLSQFASRPDDPDLQPATAQRGNEWTFELPIADGRNTSIAQFRIDRDGSNGQDAEEPVWRIRFSIDLDPLGPIHVLIALQGDDVAVSLWAERSETLSKLRDTTGELRTALTGADLGIGDIQLNAGRPDDGGEKSGALVDTET